MGFPKFHLYNSESKCRIYSRERKRICISSSGKFDCEYHILCHDKMVTDKQEDHSLAYSDRNIFNLLAKFLSNTLINSMINWELNYDAARKAPKEQDYNINACHHSLLHVKLGNLRCWKHHVFNFLHQFWSFNLCLCLLFVIYDTEMHFFVYISTEFN